MNPNNWWERDTLPLEGTVPLSGTAGTDRPMIDTIGVWLIDTINYGWYWTIGATADDAIAWLLLIPIIAVMLFFSSAGRRR